MFFFFFNDTATTEIYTLSLHDALPISLLLSTTWPVPFRLAMRYATVYQPEAEGLTKYDIQSPGSMKPTWVDRKSTRLNSSHSQISYAVFCLKKKIVRRPFREFLGIQFD